MSGPSLGGVVYVVVAGAILAVSTARTAPPEGSTSAAAPTAPTRTTLGARAKFEKADVDVGSVTRGKDVEAVFLVRSVGDEPLRILGVRPG